MAAVQAALATVWASVALGTALGLSERFSKRLTGPIRTFAVVASGALVGASLLPHALAAGGVLGLLGAVVGFAAIPCLERVARALLRSLPASNVRLEIGFAALLLHRFGDGVAMSVEGHGPDLLVALGAHEVPIVALVTLAHARRGLRHAFARAAWLGLSSSLGVALVRALPGPAWHSLHGPLDALAAGILVHIVAHEISAERPATASSRSLDLLAASLGILLVCLSGGEEAERAIGAAWLALALESAPALGLAMLASALLAAAAVPWPPGFGRDATLARRVAAPDASPEALALSWAHLGPSWTLLRLLGSLATGAITGAVLGRDARPPTPDAQNEYERDSVAAASAERPSSFPQLFGQALEAQVLRVGFWIIAGMLASSYIEVLAPAAWLEADPSWSLRALLGCALAWAARLSAPAATVVASALVDRGLEPGFTLAALTFGAALNGRALEHVRRTHGNRAGSTLIAVAASGSLVLGMWGALTARYGLGPASRAAAGGDPFEWACLVSLSLLFAFSVWRSGVRPWLAASLHARGRPEPDLRDPAHACPRV